MELYLRFVGMNPAGSEAGENHLKSKYSLKQQLVKCYDIKMVKLPGDLFYRDHYMQTTNNNNKKKETQKYNNHEGVPTSQKDRCWCST